MITTLLPVYLPLLGWTLLGILTYKLIPSGYLTWVGPQPLGRFMYWVGVPISIFGFMRGADLSGSIWLAPVMAWSAALTAGSLALGWIWLSQKRAVTSAALSTAWSQSQRGSFQLVSMLGNTGYIGYPVCLAIGGSAFFAWALFYDLLGTLFCSYGLGVWIASHYGQKQFSQFQVARNVIRSPSLWSFGASLALSQQVGPDWLEYGIKGAAWTMIPLSLMILGMRLAQVQQWQSFSQAGVALAIKLIIIPLLVGTSLSWLTLPTTGKLMIVLQSGMPPAVATLVLAEEYDLDRDITVTTLAIGYVIALFTLPLWTQLWGISG